MVTTNRDDLAERISVLRNHGTTGLPDPRTSSRTAVDDGALRRARLQPPLLGHPGRGRDRADGEARRPARGAPGVRARATTSCLADRRAPGSDRGARRRPQLPVLRRARARGRPRAAEQDDGGSSPSADIQTRPGTHAVHRLGYYRDKYGLGREDFPNAALCEDTTITLPIFPGMTDGQTGAGRGERSCGPLSARASAPSVLRCAASLLGYPRSDPVTRRPADGSMVGAGRTGDEIARSGTLDAGGGSPRIRSAPAIPALRADRGRGPAADRVELRLQVDEARLVRLGGDADGAARVADRSATGSSRPRRCARTSREAARRSTRAAARASRPRPG